MRPKSKVEGLGKVFLKKGAGRKASHNFKAINNDKLSETVYVSAAAFVNLNGEVLLAERPKGKDQAGMWEFPGGKIEDGETPEAALIRELDEELDVQVSPANITPLTFVSCDESIEGKHLMMYLFKVSKWKGVIEPLEGQKIAWVHAENLVDYIEIMPKADIPMAEYLVKNASVLK
ncbi:MAG: 8-oxo-dGTP diphosphatase [Alphaproteobacteria bacterium]|jgi:8-oxo-dGTP diphosphatase